MVGASPRWRLLLQVEGLHADLLEDVGDVRARGTDLGVVAFAAESLQVELKSHSNVAIKTSIDFCRVHE